MKKIVSIIIALVSLINVNAQRVEMNYENTFEPIFEIRNISARGTANITLNYSDVIVSINCTGFTDFSNKGVVIDDNHNCLEFVGDIEEEGAATFTVSLSDNAKQANKYIKKVTFITRGNSDITSVIGSNDAGSDTDVKFVGTNRIAIESGFDKISEFEIDFTYNDYVQLKSIMVEYGYFDDELTLTDDSYDYFGDYRYAKKVTYTRPMNSEKWGSLCLPFNYVVDDSKFSVYSIKGAGLNGSNAPITLSKVANGTEVVAGTPVFVYCTEPNLVVSSENVLLTTEDFNSSGLIYEYGKTEALNDGNENPISPSLNYTFYGTMKNVTVTDAIFVENDIFKYINGTAKTFQPYRAYFTLEGNNSGTGSLTFRVLNGSNLTSVAGVCGAEGHETDVKWELAYTSTSGVLTISGTGAMKNYYNNQPWAAFKDDITTVVIEEGVTRIGGNAFYQFTALTSVTIASSVTTIGNAVFFECTNLTAVSGASGVTYVNSSAFDGTAWKNNLPDGLTSVGHVAYLFKGDDTSVTIDAGTTQIYDNCFLGSQITSIIIPASVTTIGDQAFAHSALEKIYVLRNESTYPNTTQLGEYAFEGCFNLTIVVPTAAYSTYSGHWYSYSDYLQPGYTVTCGTAGITATTDGPLVAEYEVVTLNHNDRAGYAINGYSVKDSKNCDVEVDEDEGVYTFQMPANDVTVTATWEPANKITVTANKVGSNYWTTFYCGEAGYRIDDDEEATAYTATVDNSTVTLHLLGKVIPRGTAAIIIGEDNSISMNRDDYSTAEYSANNDLHGVNVRTLKSTLDNTGTGTFYVLGSTAKNGFGFHKYNADYMPARKAYLLLDGDVTQASSLTMVFDNETTEIKTTDFTDYTDKADTWYSLDGRKLDKQPTAKGIYIHNGRKEVVR